MCVCVHPVVRRLTVIAAKALHQRLQQSLADALEEIKQEEEARMQRIQAAQSQVRAC